MGIFTIIHIRISNYALLFNYDSCLHWKRCIFPDGTNNDICAQNVIFRSTSCQKSHHILPHDFTGRRRPNQIVEISHPLPAARIQFDNPAMSPVLIFVCQGFCSNTFPFGGFGLPVRVWDLALSRTKSPLGKKRHGFCMVTGVKGKLLQ